MDIEGLTKHQIVLLTLLVGFMTSIVTGIVTVALMSKAPPVISRTINQIVEHTIETVASSTQGASVVLQTQKTVVVKDDDLIAASIATLQKSIIRITAKGSDDLLARGVVIDTKGAALTDRAALDNSGAEAFEAILPDGRRVPVSLRDPMGTSTLAVVDVRVGTSTTLVAAPLADRAKLRLGQSVFRIGGGGIDAVSVGVVSMLPQSSADKTLNTNVASQSPGAILATLFGEVVGMTTDASLSEGASSYTLVSVPQTIQAPTTTKVETK